MDNNSQKTAASNAPTEARLKLATTAMVSNQNLHATGNGGDKGSTGLFNMEDAKKIIEEWQLKIQLIFMDLQMMQLQAV